MICWFRPSSFDLVEDALELVEEVERWFAHELQPRTRMFGSHLQSAAHVLGNQFAVYSPSRLIHPFRPCSYAAEGRNEHHYQ